MTRPKVNWLFMPTVGVTETTGASTTATAVTFTGDAEWGISTTAGLAFSTTEDITVTMVTTGWVGGGAMFPGGGLFRSEESL